ncbi:SPOR domain-containing protein [Hymenobacter negativus]|uniref:SPOR domain-containing protein n=1 Tax=Hymenobacter negativus TaxID=2795026 RepID=A0ABS3QNE4_9BACT|nr:SPOR domain-containing protein [Hymenobacter negativus]MBO2012513.1 SPOR domain-containing protein [Hymenobacter negativus]
MHLADHIRPLLRDHDCVIIPDFGGLVADVSSARAQPGRQALSPPTKLVAFNQALTRNDGLLVDALSQHTGLPIAQAREAVRTAVANLQQELDETNRTELPGIGIFRRAAGRGLAFEYTGTDNLLASAFGLPELAARPVRANDNRPTRIQPALRGAATRRTRLARLLPGGVIAMAVGLLLLANYQIARNVGYLPTNWQAPKWEWPSQSAAPAGLVTEPQQATLAQHDFTPRSMATEGMTPVEEAASTPTVASLESQPTTASLPETAPGPAPAPVAVTSPAPEKTAPIAAEIPKTTETITPTAPVAVTAPAEASVAANSVTIKARTGRYYVIAGAYSSLKSAEIGRKTLIQSGHQSHIILPPYGSRLFRLTAADFSDETSAKREAQRLRASTRSDYNTLKF